MRIPIKGYEGQYDIDTEGNIYSYYFKSCRAMKLGIMTSGYKMVNLKQGGKQKSYSLHRLLALHFIPNPNNYPQVNHKDGNKLNNELSNLEWCTQSHNIRHMYDTGLKTYKPLHYKGKFGAEHNRSKAVICVETGVVYGSQSEAARMLGISHTSVSWSIKHKRPIFGMHFQIKAL